MLERRPALRFVLLFIAGIILAAYVSVPPVFLFFISIIIIGVAVAFILINKWQQMAMALIQCSVVIIGFLLQSIQQRDFISHEIESVNGDEPVMIWGIVDSEPIQQERRVSFVIRTDSINRQEKKERNLHRIIISLRLEHGVSSCEEIKFGRKIEVQGTLEPFPFQRNPGEFDFGRYLKLNDIQGIVSVNGLVNTKVGGYKDETTLQSQIYSVQTSLYKIINTLHAPKHASFLKGIIFGHRAEIPTDVKQSFMDTGTIHILAVSGSNVAFVALMFYAILGFFRLSKKVIGSFTIIGLLIYMLITGSSPSVVRATIMAIVLLCGTLFERKSDIYNSISVAAIILLFWNTNTLFDVGFQLSFAAVISIVYFYPRLSQLIKKIPERYEEIKMIDGALKLFAVSLAAQLGTMPFIAYYFGRVSIISLVANIIVVPISGLNTFIGFAEVAFSLISPWIAQTFALANDFLVWFLLGFVKQAASVPFAYLEIWHLSTISVTIYYVLIISLFYLNRLYVRTCLLVVMLVIINCVVYADLWHRWHPKLVTTFIDVGQGDAILIEFPNGKCILIDAGSSSQRYDAGEKVIVPFLKRKGVTKVDYLLTTHPHSDHIGGVKSILRSIPVDMLVMDSLVFTNRMSREILEIAKSMNIGIATLWSGRKIEVDSNVRVYILYPNRNEIPDRNLNNNSLVLKVVYGNTAIFFVGDVETVVEQKMILHYKSFLLSDILKVGHHGSLSSTSDNFLRTAQPKNAIISVGMHNRFNHPSPFILKRLAALSIRTYSTDKLGAIVLECNGQQCIRRDWR